VALVFFGVVVMFMTRFSLASSLSDLLHEQDPSISTTRLAEAAPVIIYAAIAALLLVALPEWLVATNLIRRRRWPRIVLVPLAILHLLVVAVCAVLIPLTGWQGWLLLAALVVSGLLALAASVRTFVRSVSAWLRTRDQDGQAAG
jgi:peptidoglycan/LPS O-acetylase OafA/YrhL